MLKPPKWFEVFPFADRLRPIWHFLSTQFVFALGLAVWGLIFSNWPLTIIASLWMLPFPFFAFLM